MDQPTTHGLGRPPVGHMHLFTLVQSDTGYRHARLLIESLRVYGGPLSACPVWVFWLDSLGAPEAYPGLENVRFVPLHLPEELDGVFFGAKVYACAIAERRAKEETRSLVWLNSQCLIVNPPVLFDLGPTVDAAFRPVHIQNVGLTVQEPLDEFWGGIYRAVGLADTPLAVESFLGTQRLRPYWNTHLFSIDPALGMLNRWLEVFTTMARDPAFMSGPCQDVDHRVFLHQAILSALLTKWLDWRRMRILPPEYSYPLHFHHRVLQARRPQALNSQVCPVYEEAFRYPDTLNGLQALEPLSTWLAGRAPGSDRCDSTVEG